MLWLPVLSLQCLSLHGSCLPLRLQIFARASSLRGSVQRTVAGVSVCCHGTYFPHSAHSSTVVVSYLGLRLSCSLGCELLQGRYHGPFISISPVPGIAPGAHLAFSEFWVRQSLREPGEKWDKHWRCGGVEYSPCFGILKVFLEDLWVLRSKRAHRSTMPQRFTGVPHAWVLSWGCTKDFCRKSGMRCGSVSHPELTICSACFPLPLREKLSPGPFIPCCNWPAEVSLCSVSLTRIKSLNEVN